MEKKRKVKIGKIIIIILLLLILCILIHTIRNFIIVSRLQNISKQYAEVENYHIRMERDEVDNGHTQTDYYRSGDKKAFFIVNTNNSGDVVKLLTYYNGKRVDYFIETADKKEVQLNTGSTFDLAISNGLETDSVLQKIIASLFANIRLIEHDGRECYAIKNFFSTGMMYGDGPMFLYVDKETAMKLVYIDGDIVENFMTEVDNVDESVFDEPNIGDYDLIIND